MTSALRSQVVTFHRTAEAVPEPTASIIFDAVETAATGTRFRVNVNRRQTRFLLGFPPTVMTLARNDDVDGDVTAVLRPWVLHVYVAVAAAVVTVFGVGAIANANTDVANPIIAGVAFAAIIGTPVAVAVGYTVRRRTRDLASLLSRIGDDVRLDVSTGRNDRA